MLTETKHAEIVDQLEQKFSKKHANDQIKLPKQQILLSPVTGILQPLNQVNDFTFATGEMGKGFAIEPLDGRIFAPFTGKVKQIAPSRHYIMLENESGAIILIHIGLNTVKLNGTGFVSYVEKDSLVKKGQELIEFWDPYLRKNKIDDSVLVTVINGKKFKHFKLLAKYDQEIQALEPVAEIGEENDAKD